MTRAPHEGPISHATRPAFDAHTIGRGFMAGPAIPFVMSKPMTFRTARAWRRWLERYHDREPEALLFIYKRGAPARGLRHIDALDEALCFGWIVGKLRAHDAARFVLRFTPRRRGSVWSERNRARAEQLLRSGRMTPAGLAAVEAAKRSGAWASATRPSRPPRMPRDLREALRGNPEAWGHFRAWGRTYRSACIRWVNEAKAAATRERRIERVVWRAVRDARPGITGF